MNTPSYNALVSKDRLIKTVIELCEEVNNELALRNLPKNFLAQADLDRLLTAEGYTFTKTWNVDTQQWSFTITGNSSIDSVIDARSTSVSALVAEVNKYYRLDVPAETLAITLPTVTDATSVKSIVFYMTGGTTPSITFTSTHNVYYSNGFGIESGKTYEVNALYNGIAWVVASVEIVTSNS